MTKAQSARYWREWSKIKKMLIELAGMSPADADAERHEIHREALAGESPWKRLKQPLVCGSVKELRERCLDEVFEAYDRGVNLKQSD